MTLEVFIRVDPYVGRHERKIRELGVGSWILDVDPYSQHWTRKQWPSAGHCLTSRLISLIPETSCCMVLTLLTSIEPRLASVSQLKLKNL